MIRLNLPSGTVATVSFIHRRDPHYVVACAYKVISSPLPIIDKQQPTWEDAVTYARVELLFGDGSTFAIEAQARCSRDEMFCYYKGRYEALQNVFKAELDVRDLNGEKYLLPDDKLALLQYFAPQKFTKTKAEARALKDALAGMRVPLPKRSPIGSETVIDTFAPDGELLSERVIESDDITGDDVEAAELYVENTQAAELNPVLAEEIAVAEIQASPDNLPLVG